MESSQKRLTSLIELTIAGNAESICENLETFSDEFCRLAETTEKSMSHRCSAIISRTSPKECSTELTLR